MSNNKFNWSKVNKSKLVNDKGSYNYKDEANHNKNLDNLWEQKFKGKFKSFFDKWNKEKSKFN